MNPLVLMLAVISAIVISVLVVLGVQRFEEDPKKNGKLTVTLLVGVIIMAIDVALLIQA